MAVTERPNPLTDELTDDAKAELAALFAELRRWYPPTSHAILRQRPQWWER